MSKISAMQSSPPLTETGRAVASAVADLAGLSRALLWMIAVAVVIEVLFLRILLRMGPMLPPLDWLPAVFVGMQYIGLVAMNVAFLAAVLVMLQLGVGLLYRPRRRRDVALGVLALAATGQLAVGPVLSGLTTGTLLASSALAGVAIGIAALGTLAMVAPRAVVLAMAVGAMLAHYHYASQAAASLGLVLPGGLEAIRAAEVLALIAALVAPALLRRPAVMLAPATRMAIAAGAIATILFLGFWAARPWIAAAATMWNVGFTLALPGPLYAVGLGVVVAVVLAGLRSGERRLALGLLLVSIGGLKVDYTYFALVSLLGFLLLCQACNHNWGERMNRVSASVAQARMKSPLPRL